MHQKSVLMVAHCFFNRHSKVYKHTEIQNKEEAEIKGRLLTLLLKNQVGTIQLPCPEMLCYGLKRWGHVKDQFQHPHYTGLCKEILTPHVDSLIEYRNNSFEFLGVVGIERSPSCGIHESYTGTWKGEISGNPHLGNQEANGISLSPEKGVFMEILEAMLLQAGFETPRFFGYSSGECGEFEETIKRLIEEDVC